MAAPHGCPSSVSYIIILCTPSSEKTKHHRPPFVSHKITFVLSLQFTTLHHFPLSNHVTVYKIWVPARVYPICLRAMLWRCSNSAAANRSPTRSLVHFLLSLALLHSETSPSLSLTAAGTWACWFLSAPISTPQCRWPLIHWYLFILFVCSPSLLLEYNLSVGK